MRRALWNDGGRWLVKQGIANPAKLSIVGWSYGGYAALQSAVLDPALFKAIVAVAPVTDLETLRSEWRYFSNYAIVDALSDTVTMFVRVLPRRMRRGLPHPC